MKTLSVGHFPIKYYKKMCLFHQCICSWKLRTIGVTQYSDNMSKIMYHNKESAFSNVILHGNDFSWNKVCMKRINVRHLCTLNSPKARAVDVQDDITCDNTEELFSTITKSSFMITTDNVISILNELHRIIFSNLINQHTWLIDKPHIVYRQLFLNKKFHLLDCVIQHDAFQHLLLNIESLLDRMTVDMLPEVLVNLLYLGLSHSHSLVHQMYFRILEHCPEYDIYRLRKIVEIRTLLEDRNPMLVNELHKRVVDLITRQTDVLSGREFDSFCRVVTYLNTVYTPYTMIKCNQFIKEQFKNLDLPNTPITIGQFLKFLNLSGSRKTYKKSGQMSKHVTSKITEDFIHNLDIVTIFVMSKELKTSGDFHKGIRMPMMKKSLEFLKEDTSLRISKFTGILPVFTKDISADTREYLESLVLRYIPDADIVNIVSILHFVHDTNCENRDVLKTLTVKLLEYLKGLSEYRGSLNLLLSCLSNKFDLISEQRMFKKMIFKLLKLLPRLPPHHNTDIQEVMLFLLKFDKTISQNLFNCMLRIIPNSPVLYLLRCSSVLKTKKHMEANSYDYWKFLAIQSCISDTLCQKLKEAQSLPSVLYYLNNLSHFQKSRILPSHLNMHGIFKKVQTSMIHYMPTMTSQDFSKIVQFLQSFEYCQPEVLEYLASYSMENVHQISIFQHAGLVRLLSTMGHIPQNFEAFSDFCVQRLNESNDEFSTMTRLWHLVHLCFLQIFPENYLSAAFTLESIEEIDNIIADNPHDETRYRVAMMLLNRFAVLDCPQLNIPWFHETFLIDFPATHVIQTSLKRDVEIQTSKILGGPEFYRRNVSAPYCYNLDLLFHLDAEKNPIPYNVAESVDASGCEKIVVQALKTKSYCSETRTLRGYMQMQSRHLELIGYKVVNVFADDWISKNDRNNRNHISKLIFGDSVNKRVE